MQTLTWSYVDIDQLIHGVAPALMRVSPAEEPPTFLVIVRSNRQHVTLLTPTLGQRRVTAAVITHHLRTLAEAPFARLANELLASVNIAPARRAKVRSAMIGEQMSGVQLTGCWRLRLAPGANMWRQFRQARLLTPVALILAAHFVQQLFSLAGWWLIGQGALQGHFAWAWIFAWALLLYTAIPFQLFVTWIQSRIGLDAGALFKTRLLYGTLHLEPEEIRHEGIGQFLGRIMESEAFETLVLTGGFQGLIAIIELFTAFTVLTVGPGGWPAAGLFGLWVGLTSWLMGRYVYTNRAWVDAYRTMTNDLVERMVGHRTRIAQEERTRWHEGEDQFLARYLGISQQLDQVGMQLNGWTNRGWQLVGFASLALAFVTAPFATTQLALGIGGVMLASQALSKFVAGIAGIAGILVAWEQVGPIFTAAQRSTARKSAEYTLLPTGQPPVEQPPVEQPPVEQPPADPTAHEPLLVARDLTFRYPRQLRPLLQGCHVTLHIGERILLEGPSGGGKSTLAALLVGLRKPEAGLLLLHGLDQATLGMAQWRKRLAAAPQFHENHVLTETFAFNLLMGRRWPATPEDLAEAETICHELGLGNLLARMPAGLQQMVGESGWQLSHGERSRLFMARALLQDADLIVLDESFAALDPDNLQQAIQCVLARAKTLLVIAHP
ncbi:MAG: ABC transporter ATP-binding protein [Caldilineaceae bacterium]